MSNANSLELIASESLTSEQKNAANSWIYRFIIELDITAGYDKTLYKPRITGKKLYAYYRIWLRTKHKRFVADRLKVEYREFLKQFDILLKQRSPEFKKIRRRYYRLRRGCFSSLPKPSKQRIEKLYNSSQERLKEKLKLNPVKKDRREYQLEYQRKNRQKIRALRRERYLREKKAISKFKRIYAMRSGVFRKRRQFFEIQKIKAAFDEQKNIFYDKEIRKKIKEESRKKEIRRQNLQKKREKEQKKQLE
jgi:hypothetical protein